jgi:hypothetical protein
MVFRRRKRQESRADRKSEAGDYTSAMMNRLHTLQTNGGVDYDEADAKEVEARIRRMFYGAKKEDDFEV